MTLTDPCCHGNQIFPYSHKSSASVRQRRATITLDFTTLPSNDCNNYILNDLSIYRYKNYYKFEEVNLLRSALPATCQLHINLLKVTRNTFTGGRECPKLLNTWTRVNTVARSRGSFSFFERVAIVEYGASIDTTRRSVQSTQSSINTAMHATFSQTYVPVECAACLPRMSPMFQRLRTFSM